MNVVSTRAQAKGAIPNKTIVEKTNSMPGDTHKDGAQAKVVGSMGPAYHSSLPSPYIYFVEWTDVPGVPVAISGNRIKVLEGTILNGGASS